MRCKKILIAFGSNVYSEQEIDFTLRYLAQPQMLVVGAMLTDIQGAREHKPCEESKCKGGGLACVQKKVQRDRLKIYDYLQEKCKEADCKGVVHQEQGCSLEALMQETRYADLLVLSQETYLAYTKGGCLAVSKVLEKCSCPVLVLPPLLTELEQIIMTFDGSARAMSGIKQFAYVLAGLAQALPVTVLSTYQSGNELTASEEKLFIEYLKQHFKNVAMHRLCENSEHTLISAVGLNENALVVVNNPSPYNLPILSNILNGAATLHSPLQVYTQGATDKMGEPANA